MSEPLGGRYEPLEVVGRGAQGEVLRARDTRHDRLVALKVRAREGDRDELLAEARALYGCRPHASLPLLRDDFFDADRYVLVMDWVDGVPLAPGAPLPEIVDALAQVAAALDHLHAHTPPLIHGDVKPSNILVTASGGAVLVDLGLTTATTGGVVAGTAGFMAPEAARGEIAPAADIYGLAATAYALLTGAPPRAGTSPEWLALTAEEAARVEAALGAGLALDPASRPASASALVAALRGSAVRKTNLPAEVTSFVGRHAEVDRVRAALRAARTLTLTGPGGIGKTRLALRALSGAPGAVWFAGLAAVRDPDRVASAVADALSVPDDPGVSRVESLIAHLGDLDVTIILDNCEQVIDGCASFVDALTRACPNVTVVATSREPLGVWGEEVILVPPLDVGSEAAPLFVARARAQRASLTFDDTTEQLVREICRKLDGLPLAIELAAANLRTTPLDELAARVAAPLDLAGPRVADERQRTLRGLIDWSYDLLDQNDRRSFAALSVFAGSIGVDEGTAVCGDRGALTRLADRSLLTLRTDRYEMLETIRAYAAERLTDPIPAREAHLDAILALAEEAAPHLHGGGQARWLDRLAADHESVRAALLWAIEREDGARALRLASSIGRYLELRGHLREGRDLLDAALQVPSPDDVVRAAVLRIAGVFAHRLGDLPAARLRYAASLTLARALDDSRAISDCLQNLGAIEHMEGDADAAGVLWDEALSLRRALGYSRGIADTLMNLSFLASDRGDLEKARSMLSECVETFRSLGDRSGVGDALSNLALVDEMAGDLDARLAHHHQSLEIRRELGDRWGTAISLANLAAARRDGGDRETAVRDFEEALQLLGNLESKDLVAFVECGLALAVDDAGRARRLLGGSLRARADLHDVRGIAECLEALAPLAADGAPLLHAAEGIRATGGFPRTPFEEERIVKMQVARGPRLGTPIPLEEAIRQGLLAAGKG